MAFEYRVPAESVISKLTSEETAKITSSVTKRLQDNETTSGQYFSFSIGNRGRELLSRIGVPLSPFSFQVHSHPVCKTLENHILLNVCKNLIDPTFSVIGMKDSKIVALRHKSQMPTLKALNRFAVSKDLVRYGYSKYFQGANERVDLSQPYSESIALKSLVPSCIANKKSKRFFLHDELHYWSMNEISTFLDILEPEVIVATHVYPKEILAGAKRSLNPWCYEFEMDKEETIHFFPDGVRSEAYSQPVHGGDILCYNRVVTKKNLVFAVDLVYNAYSHSVIVITKTNLSAPATRFFSGFDGCSIGSFNFFGGSVQDVVPIRAELITKIFLYLKTLKKPDVESALAKLRQSTPDPTGFEIIFMEEFASIVNNTTIPKNMLEQSLWDFLRDSAIDVLPSFLRRQFSSVQGRALKSLIADLRELSIRVDCRSFESGKNFLSPIISFLSPNSSIEPLPVLKRRSQPYQMNGPFFSGEVCTNRRLLVDLIQHLKTLSLRELRALNLLIFASFTRGVNLQGLNVAVSRAQEFFGSRVVFRFVQKAARSFFSNSGAVLLLEDGTQERSLQHLHEHKDLMREVLLELLNTVGPVESEPEVLHSVPNTSLEELNDPPPEQDEQGVTEQPTNLITADEVPRSFLNNLNLFNVPGDGSCFVHALSLATGLLEDTIIQSCLMLIGEGEENEPLRRQISGEEWVERDVIEIASAASDVVLTVLFDRGEAYPLLREVFNQGGTGRATLLLKDNHFSPLIPKNGCVLRAFAAALKRDEVELLTAIKRSGAIDIVRELMEGQGLSTGQLDRLCCIFSVHGSFLTDGKMVEFNPKGKISAHFLIEKDHLILASTEMGANPIDMAGTSTFDNEVRAEELVVYLGVSKAIQYNLSLDRAKDLQDCLLRGLTGKICSTSFSNQEPWINEETERRFVSIIPVVGTFGSGKSRGIVELVKLRTDIKFVIISPRRALADDFKSKLGISTNSSRKNVDVITFEVALKRKEKKNTVVIFDETQLFPPGYLDLYLLYNTRAWGFIACGDPMQSSYDSESDRPYLGDKENDLCNILNGQEYDFLFVSRRFRNSFFANRLPCEMHEDTMKCSEEVYGVFNSKAEAVTAIQEADVFLVASFEEKIIIRQGFGFKKQILTFGESTGLTFRHVAVVLTQTVRSVDNRRMLVALSRASHTIDMINLTGESFASFIESLEDSVLREFCTKKASFQRIRTMLPGKPNLVKFFKKLGGHTGERELRLAGDPWLKTMIFLGQQPDQTEEVAVEREMSPERKSKTHCPLVSRESLRAGWVDRMGAKEIREVRIKDMTSEQFTDSFGNNSGKAKVNQCELYEAIYPRHRHSDTVTFIMAVKKRLIFSNPMKEMQRYRAALNRGEIMFQVFMKHVPLKPGLDQSMLESCINDFEEKKLSKSTATIANHSSRSEPEWNVEQIFLFMKSQRCTKFDNRFRDAKAGQTISCFAHRVLTRFATYIRYIEKKVLEVLPKNFYIHSGKNFDQLNDWVIEMGFNSVCTESDYEAFDASQDATTLAFEVKLMQYLRFPSDLVMDYIFIKTHVRCNIGHLATMRFSGEAGTFLFNTLVNMVFTFMRYEVKKTDAICFAGDDMCANRELKWKREFEPILDRLKLKAKVQFTMDPTFCGWCLTRYGIYKKPQLVHERFEISQELGTVDECIENYAIEVSYAYKLGDIIAELMSEEEMDAHRLCVRFIVQNRHKLHSWVKDVYQSCLG